MATQASTPQPADSANKIQESAALPSNQPVPAGRGSLTNNQTSGWAAALLEKVKDPKNNDDIPIAQVLDHVSQFLARYLECSEHQRTIMALWVLHAQILSGAQVTPYLAIQSTEKQSGKTLCLQLLSMLITHHAFTAGFTPTNLTRRIDPAISTILLDECHATIGTRSRPKNPLLRALLASGYHRGPGYTDATHERNLFAPKAFAGRGPLPEELADRCISIVLKPLSETSNVEPFHLSRASKEANPLRDLLHLWGDRAESDLLERPLCRKEDFPPNLSPRRRDMLGPLLQLADFIGGEWPRRLREAIPTIFREQADFELRESLQLLADIRDCFARHGYPERLSTSDLLAWLQNRSARLWDVNGPITARRLAQLLAPFDVVPRVQRIDKTSRSRGYQRQDFVEHWQKHLNFKVPVSVTPAAHAEIPNKDAACHAVTHSAAISGGNPALGSMASERSASESGNKSGSAATAPDDPMAWLPPILPPSPNRMYNFGPHSSYDVEIIRHFGAQGYKALSEMEAHRMEFTCGNIPFGTMNPRIGNYPAKPVRSVKPAEPPMTEAERDAAMAKIRRDREAPPACAQRENIRLAPQKRR